MDSLAVPVRFGVLNAALLVGYFYLLAQRGMHIEPLYSLGNVFIMSIGIFLAVAYRRIRLAERFNFLLGFGTGTVTGFVATLLFSTFFTVYAIEVEPGFLDRLTVVGAEYFDHLEYVTYFSVVILGLTTTVGVTLGR